MRIIIFWILSATIIFAQVEVLTKTISTAKKFGEKNLIEYRIISKERTLTIINKEFDYDLPTPKLLFINKNRFLLVNSFSSSLELLDADGKTLKRVFLSSNHSEYERSIFSEINGDKIIAAVNESTLNSHQLFLIDEELNILSSSEIYPGLISGIALNNKSEIIFSSVILTSENEIKRIIRVNNFDFSYENSFTGSFSFSVQKDGIPEILLYDNDNYILFDLTSGGLLLSKNIEIAKIRSANLFVDKIALLTYHQAELLNSEWNYLNPEIIILNKNGEITKRVKPDYEKFTSFKWIEENLNSEENLIKLE